MNTISICRVCLSGDDYLVYKDIFMEHNCYFICDMINTLSNVHIKAGDGLPNTICEHCLRELEEAVKFKLKCENSNSILATTPLETILESAKQKRINFRKKSDEELDEDVKLECFDNDIESHDNLTDTLDLDCTSNVEVKMEPGLDSVVKAEPLVKVIEPKMILGKDGVLKKSKAVDLQLICEDCGGKFKSKCKLRVHFKKVHLTEKLICKLCKVNFKSYKAYKSHKDKAEEHCKAALNMIITGIGKSRVFQCKFCEHKTKCMDNMKVHLVTHTGERSFKCPLCDKTFAQSSSLSRHKDYVHKLTDGVYTCHHCGKQFNGRYRCNNHIHRVHGSDQFEQNCPVCNKTFKTKVTLKYHMLRHSGGKTFQCEKCSKSFYTNGELSTHMRYAHMEKSVTLKPFECDICGYKMAKNSDLIKHKSKHSDDNVACMVCGLFFTNTARYKFHLQVHDIDKKSNVCPNCNNVFSTRKNLLKHFLVVHGPKRQRSKQKKPKDNEPTIDELNDIKSVPKVVPKNKLDLKKSIM